MKIGVLTSSRADYGIYKPLLDVLFRATAVDLQLIVFGMHLLEKFGSTVNLILSDNYGPVHRVEGMLTEDDSNSITKSYGQLIVNFSDFWQKNDFDIVIALGDRFEMSAAIQSTISYEIPIAHLHGGETTLGAVDNIYRHQITLASRWHFVATDEAREKVVSLIGSDDNVHNVGALSLDGLESADWPDWNEVAGQFNIPLVPFALITVHPETVAANRNSDYALQLKAALSEVCQLMHLVFTMTNADAMGSIYRQMAHDLKSAYPDKITLVENFGKENYFSAMAASAMLIGNTSSGILEAASFKKFVVNIGDRQKGRLQSANVINVPFSKKEIIAAIERIIQAPVYNGDNLYHQSGTALKIYDSLTNASI